MNKRTVTTIYSLFLALALLGSELFLLAKFGSATDGAVKVVIGLLLALLFVTPFHEVGHIIFAAATKMRTVYAKLSFFCIIKQGGRYALKLANPFAADMAQVAPTTGGNMRKRTFLYAMGGLVFSLLLIVAVVLVSVFGDSVVALGMLPYAAYIFLLNAAPCEYPTGKTDAAVCLGIWRNEPTEKAMISALDIQGQLYKQSRYSEISEELFEFPILREDEPVFLLCWDLKYCRALDSNDFDGAVECIKRISQAEEYMNATERQRLAAELTYLHAINGDFEKANEACKYCEDFLRAESSTAKRVLATVACLSGKTEEGELLIKSGLQLLEKIEIYGERKLEESLLLRINTEDLRKLKKENDYGRNDESIS